MGDTSAYTNPYTNAIEKLQKALIEADEDERTDTDEIQLHLTVAEGKALARGGHYHRMESLAHGIEPVGEVRP